MVDELPPKACTKCGRAQPPSEYYLAKGGRDGLRGDCKSCFRLRAAERYKSNPEPIKQRARQWAADNPERVQEQRRQYTASGRKASSDRRSYLKRTAGISLEEYAVMLESQDGRCCICDALPTPGISLHVDHDHLTGRRRRLLCFRCNNALGDFNDDPSLLRTAAAYLEEFEVASARHLALARLRAG